MADIGFIGAGNMGGPMLANLIKAGHAVSVFDLSEAALDAAREAGAVVAESPGATAAGKAVVITMLPAGTHVRDVYMGDGGVLERAGEETLLIDCSTIDVTTAREICEAAAGRGLEMVDAPVSGGVAGAAAGTLTFMVGGTESAFARAEPVLEPMAKAVVHAGPSGNGQAAKVCNNMMLAASMIVTSEAFALADRLGLERQTMFDIVSTATGQCWALTSYCPVPGPVPASPANRDYQPGFTAAMMNKDLKLAQQAAEAAGAATPIGAEAARLYDEFCADGNDELDFSAIFKLVDKGR
jgi:3-hydroxyisobutyrate dehydrogenase